MSRRELLELLAEIYRNDAPRDERGRVPPEQYARYSTEDVDRIWDFDRRHLMHRVAKALTDGVRK